MRGPLSAMNELLRHVADVTILPWWWLRMTSWLNREQGSRLVAWGASWRVTERVVETFLRGDEIFLLGVTERFWVELREKAWDRRQLEGRPFELGRENWSKRGINTQKDCLDRRKYRYCFYKLQFYFFHGHAILLCFLSIIRFYFDVWMCLLGTLVCFYGIWACSYSPYI